MALDYDFQNKIDDIKRLKESVQKYQAKSTSILPAYLGSLNVYLSSKLNTTGKCYLLLKPKENFHKISLKVKSCELDGLVVRVAYCSCRGAQFSSQHLDEMSTMFWNSGSRGPDTLFSSPWTPIFPCTYPHTNRLKYTQLIKNKINTQQLGGKAVCISSSRAVSAT